MGCSVAEVLAFLGLQACRPIVLPFTRLFVALTDLQAMQGGLTRGLTSADIVHDDVKQTRVKVEGQVNQQPFVIERAAGRSFPLLIASHRLPCNPMSTTPATPRQCSHVQLMLGSMQSQICCCIRLCRAIL